MPKAGISENLDIKFKLQPKERQLLSLMAGPASLIGYGGARGGAKSHAARSAAILRRLRYPGTPAVVFRRTYQQLYDQHILPMMTEWPELFRAYWSGEHKLLMLPGNSPVSFRYADTMKDVLEQKGREYGDLFIDEATDFSEDELKILYSCARCTVLGFTPKKVLTFNPGGIGHGYVKRLFIDKNATPEEQSLNPAFIQAHAWDNLLWVRQILRDRGITAAAYYAMPREEQIALLLESPYGKELNALPEHLRKAWLYGDWDTFLGQKFQEFRRDVHTIEPFAVPSWWRRWRANDPGYSDPSCWHWFAADGDGQVYCYREATFSRTVPSEQAKEVKRLSVRVDELDARRLLVPEEIDFTVTGMDAFVTKDRAIGKTDVSYYQEGGVSGLVRPIHGADSRAARAKTLHEYLRITTGKDGKLGAKLKIFRPGKIEGVTYGCPKLIETLPSLVADEHDPEKVRMCDTDHWYDSFSYGLSKWHADRSSAPAETFPRFSAGDILDHTAFLAKMAGGGDDGDDEE